MIFLDKYSKFILAIALLLFLSYFYSEVLLSPNSYLFGSGGDGAKNYFTYVSQIKEASYTQSTAMNYPYGEHFMYLDCHPVFTIIIKALAKVFPFVAENSIGIINFLMIISIPITAWLIYLILVRYSVRPFLAVIACFAIALLAPQIFRINGHYALGYSFFIPLTWYLVLRFQESSKKWKWTVIICLNTLFWFFTHAYLGMILVTFFMICAALEVFNLYRQKRLNFQCFAHPFIQFILPFLVIFLYSKLSDTHFGRSTNPFGLLEASASFSSVFLPNRPPLSPYFFQFNLVQPWEGLAYIGSGMVIAVIVISILVIYWLIRYRRLFFKDLGIPQPLTISMLAAVFILLLSFGYPFKWYPKSLDYFSVLKNFRGIGRFAWIFYFIVTVFVIVFIYNYFNKKGKPLIASILIFLISGLMIWESTTYHNILSSVITKSPNYYNEKLLSDNWKSALKSVDFSTYQAIIPLPYYHIGSENMGKESTNEMYMTSMVLGYHSNLPLVANYSTRTSLWEAKNSMQIISPVFYSKPFEKDIADERPFLIVYRNEELLEFEQELLNRSKEIYRNSEFAFYEVSKANLFSSDASKWLANFDSKKDQLLRNGDFLLDTKDSNEYFFFENFESTPNKIHFRGKGALHVPKSGYTLLKKFEIGELEEGKEYIASFWLYNAGKNYGQDLPNGLFFLQVEDENLEWTHIHNIDAGLSINGNWSLIEMKFTGLKNVGSSLYIHGDNFIVYWDIDDFMIRPVTTTVYREDKGELFMNNHRIKR